MLLQRQFLNGLHGLTTKDSKTFVNVRKTNKSLERYLMFMGGGCLNHIFFPKVYCQLCCCTILATSDSLKKHCKGYISRKGADRGSFKESVHSIQAKARDSRARPEPVVQGDLVQPTIIVNVIPVRILYMGV